MAGEKRRTLLFQDEEGVFTPEALSRAAATPLCTVTKLKHPRTGLPALFMFKKEELLEVQVIRPNFGQFSSYFVDQRVQSEGDLFVASRIDPLLLLLPHLREHAARWCPLDQLLASSGCLALRQCRQLWLDRLCDVSDRLGPDELLYKANDAKVLAWLRGKVTRICGALEAGKGLAVGGGNGSAAAGSNSFSAQLQSAPAATGAVEVDEKAALKAARLLTAVGLIAEYLNDDWGAKVAASFQVKVADVFQSGASGAAKKRPAAWEGGEEDDRNLQLSAGAVRAPSTAAAKVGLVAKKGAKRPKPADAKGMRSIGSFFSKKSA